MATLTLDDVRAQSDRAFPARVLRGQETALVLFAAAFNGRQDAIHVADAGLVATCVDNDGRALDRMYGIYPPAWSFVEADVFEYAESTGSMWDVVTVDCPTGAFERCAELLGLWCDLARHAVVLGTGDKTTFQAPDGWALQEIVRRSDFAGGVYWAVFQRC